MLAIIGGSGLARLAGLEGARARIARTPYGEPSGPLLAGRLAGGEVVFLARHGERNHIPPHEVNYRANLWALREAGAADVVSVASVGGIRADLGPGTLALPDQILDYTHGRGHTFVTRGERPVDHIDFTHPYCERLRQKLLRAARSANEAIAEHATYAATQGPRLETAAEIDRIERDGGDIVGMTAMPEASLARELGLCYAAVAVVVNHAAGRATSATGIRLEDIRGISDEAMARVQRILAQLLTVDGD